VSEYLLHLTVTSEAGVVVVLVCLSASYRLETDRPTSVSTYATYRVSSSDFSMKRCAGANRTQICTLYVVTVYSWGCNSRSSLAASKSISHSLT
jgi:hypothetical protein